MDITGSGNVAIDWNSFNIAADEIVNFKNMQAVLNYVSGGSKVRFSASSTAPG